MSQRESEEEIPVPISPGRTAQKDQEASRPHPPPLIILPTAGIPSSSSHSRLKPMQEYGSWGHFGQETATRLRRRVEKEKEDLADAGGRHGHVVSVVDWLHISCQTPSPSLFSTHSLHLPLHPPPHLSFFSLSFWHSRSLRYSSA